MCPQTSAAHTPCYWDCPLASFHFPPAYSLCQVTTVIHAGPGHCPCLQHPSPVSRVPQCSSSSSPGVSPGFTQAPFWASTPVQENTGLCHSGLFIRLCLHNLALGMFSLISLKLLRKLRPRKVEEFVQHYTTSHVSSATSKTQGVCPPRPNFTASSLTNSIRSSFCQQA